MHKSPGTQCEGCKIKLNQCHPSMIAFTKAVQAEFPDCHVAVGFRDQADQHIAFISGKSKVDWPNSNHNKVVNNATPESHAVDLFMLSQDGHAYFLSAYYGKIWEFYKNNKDKFPSLNYNWGGLFVHLRDLDHFEVKL